MKKLQLSLKKEWFEMTKEGIKTEDYREVNEYWAKRLLYTVEYVEYEIFDEMISDINHMFTNPRHDSIQGLLEFFGFKIRLFTHNIMTLGYPKANDTERILTYEHAGIEIREGNPDWGAEKGKIYFIIKHGKRIEL